MFDIDKLDNIKLTRGDSMTLQVALYRDGELYEPDPLDVISFSVRKEYTDDTAAISKISWLENCRWLRPTQVVSILEYITTT